VYRKTGPPAPLKVQATTFKESYTMSKFISRNFRFNATALFNAVVEGAVGGTAVGTPEVKVVLTRAEKQAKLVKVLTDRIAADTAKLAELRNEVETSARLDGVGEGSAVVARIGRGETSKEVSARVLGVKEDENGSRRYKIAFGSGFDADTVIIQPSQIVSVIVEDAPGQGQPEQPVEASAVETTEVGRDEFDRPVNVYGQVIGA
jgi:hypothetical protein